MTDQTAALHTILTDVGALLREKFCEIGLPDTPFVLMAVGPDNGPPLIRANIGPAGMREMAEDLAEAADSVPVWPANDDEVH